MGNISDILYEKFEPVNADKIYGNMITYIEKIVIKEVLERTNGNQLAAAKRLGLHRNTLHNKIKKFKIDVRRFKK